MKRFYSLTTVFTTLVVISSSTLVVAQTERALDRRLDRNARQIQRQANRAEYFGEKEWNTLTPWIQQNRITPLQRAATASAHAVGNAAGRDTRPARGAVRAG